MNELGLENCKLSMGNAKSYSGNATDQRIINCIDTLLCRNEQIILNTINHEIAHVLVGTKNHHNIIWQTKAKELGVIWKCKYRK